MRTPDTHCKCYLTITAAYGVIAGLALVKLGLLLSLPEVVLFAAYLRLAVRHWIKR
ncbi:MAG: hypothetical protein ABSA58_20985 [Acetobacteraceae bacterium]|jgi:hypothetical protein